MPEMHLKHLGFTYSACGPSTKNKERIQKFKETGDSQYIYQNELDKVCFQYDMAYGDFKNLSRRTASDKILCDKAFNVAKNPKYKKTSGGTVKNENFSDKELTEELHKPIIRRFKFLLCVIDIYSKHAWVTLLKDKKGITITNGFQKILNKSKHKSNKIWVDKDSEFYDTSMKLWLEKMM